MYLLHQGKLDKFAVSYHKGELDKISGKHTCVRNIAVTNIDAVAAELIMVVIPYSGELLSNSTI